MAVTHIGNYQVQGEIARGAMGVVFRARDPALARDVAVKVLLAQSASESDLQRFRLEAQATARLRHPNIVAVQAAGVHQGKPFLVMDLIEGGSLKDLLGRQGKLGGRRAAEVVEKLARALDYAHGLGILHRDIKPGNVLIDPGGEPLLTDFGLAKVLGRDDKITLSGEIHGTPVYMAPEQALGDRERMGTPMDTYALGATLYEMITGQPPFKGKTVIGVLSDVQSVTPPAPTKLVPLLDRPLEAICVQAMQKDPADRFGSAREMADALAAYLRGELDERALEDSGRAARPGRRGRGPWLIAVGVAGALAVTCALGWANARAQTLADREAGLELRAELEAAQAGEQVAKAALAALQAQLDGRVAALLQRTELTGGAEAVQLLSNATALDPDDASLWIALAEARSAQGQVEEARRDFDRAIEVDAERARAWVGRAKTWRLQGDTKAAAADVERALKLGGEDAAAHAELGAIALARGDLRGAVASCDRALREDADLPAALEVRSMALLTVDDASEAALKDLERLARLRPGEAQTQLYTGLVLSRLDRDGQARESLGRAIALAGDDAQLKARALCERALLSQYRGQAEDADRDMELAAAAAPSSATVLAYQGVLLTLREEDDQALKLLSQALAKDPSCGLALEYRARILGSRGEFEAAKADYERALGVVLGRLAVRRALKDLATREARWETVEAQWTELLKLAPDEVAGYVSRASARLKLGDRDGAIADLETYVGKAKHDPREAEKVQGAEATIEALERLERQ